MYRKESFHQKQRSLVILSLSQVVSYYEEPSLATQYMSTSLVEEHYVTGVAQKCE